MNFPRTRVTDAEQSEKVDTIQPDPIIVYSESDIEAFDRLQVIAGRNKSSVRKNSASTGVSVTMEGYSDSDNSQFNDLAKNLEGLQQQPKDGFVAQEIKAEPVEIDYSQADNQAFNRLRR